MKIKPEIYAETLITSLKTETDAQKIARNFWYFLQKNGQYKELSNILESLDKKFAEMNDMVLAKVYTAEKLSDQEMDELIKKLKTQYKKDIIIKNIIKKNQVAGIIVRVDDTEVDLSLRGKINRLRTALSAE